jgi:hypothetical protein
MVHCQAGDGRAESQEQINERVNGPLLRIAIRRRPFLLSGEIEDGKHDDSIPGYTQLLSSKLSSQSLNIRGKV